MWYKFTNPQIDCMNWLNSQLVLLFRNLQQQKIGAKRGDLEALLSQEFFLRLKSAPKLKDLLVKFLTQFEELTLKEKEQVFDVFFKIQDVDNLLQEPNIDSRIFHIDALPSKIRQPTKDFFSFMYPSTLNYQNCIDSHYAAIWESLKAKKQFVCPFCGIEPMFNPLTRRQDYDHLLAQETYPFLSVNVNNLVPMGRDCNQIFKFRGDIVKFIEQNRQCFTLPYGNDDHVVLTIETNAGFRALANLEGQWRFEFSPFDAKLANWVQIFQLEYRYGAEVLDKYYLDWIDEVIDLEVEATTTTLRTANDWRTTFEKHADVIAKRRLLEPNNILKSGLFRFLSDKGEDSIFIGIQRQFNEKKGFAA